MRKYVTTFTLIWGLALAVAVILTLVLTLQSLKTAEVPSGPTLDLKLLVITGDGTEPSFNAITLFLDRIGIPYQEFIAANRDLTPEDLSDEGGGLYQGIILASGNLVIETAPGSWQNAFTPEEWDILWDYEITHQIRQLDYYSIPDGMGGSPDDYGLTLTRTVNTETSPLEIPLTSAGQEIFDYINPNAAIPIESSWTYLARQNDPNTEPLLITAEGDIVASKRLSSNGREVMVFMMDNSESLIHSLILSYGAIDWVTKGLFLGERHVYLSPQIDDIFIANGLWDSEAQSDESPDLMYRLTGDDLGAVVDWQTAVRQNPMTVDFQLEMAYNRAGAQLGKYPNDTFTPVAKELQHHFAWSNHTWSHPNLDNITDVEIIAQELQGNIDLAGEIPLTIFDPTAMVTPEISGLRNQAFLDAAYNLGIRSLVCDHSQIDGSCQSDFNTGFPNRLQPGIWEVPRYPTDLFVSSSTPEEQVDRYNQMHQSTWGRELTYSEIIEEEADAYLSYMLSYDIYPLMFHQSNLRAYDGSHTLLGDAMDKALQKYNKYLLLPVRSLTLAEIAAKTKERATYISSGVSAALHTDGGSITITAAPDSVIPVTGVNYGSNKEVYGGETISYITIPDSGSITIPRSARADSKEF